MLLDEGDAAPQSFTISSAASNLSAPDVYADHTIEGSGPAHPDSRLQYCSNTATRAPAVLTTWVGLGPAMLGALGEAGRGMDSPPPKPKRSRTGSSERPAAARYTGGLGWGGAIHA